MPAKSRALQLINVASRSVAVTPIAMSEALRRGEPSMRKTSAVADATRSENGTTPSRVKYPRAVAIC